MIERDEEMRVLLMKNANRRKNALNSSAIDLDGKSRHHEVADALLLSLEDESGISRQVRTSEARCRLDYR